jgi:hypothetical protein
MTTRDPLIQYYTNKLTTALESDQSIAAIKTQYGNSFLVFPDFNVQPTKVKISVRGGRVICDCVPMRHSKEIAMITPKLCGLWKIAATPTTCIIPLGYIISPPSEPVRLFITYPCAGDFPACEEIDPVHLKFIA